LGWYVSGTSPPIFENFSPVNLVPEKLAEYFSGERRTFSANDTVLNFAAAGDEDTVGCNVHGIMMTMIMIMVPQQNIRKLILWKY